jgi:threonine/homoserine/homoserine lactone efflux protein
VDVSLIIQGMVIGLTLAAPVGPIALICIRRTVAEGKFHGMASGLGVATADSFYAAVAVLGLTIISGFIIANQDLFRTVASIGLVLIGVKIYLSIPPGMCPSDEHGTYLKDYFSMVAIAIMNPLTLLFFVAILPGFGIVFPGTSFLSSVEFVAGVFLGSTAWWVFLSTSLGSVRSCISSDNLRLINRVSGILITCIGVALFLYIFIPGLLPRLNG